MRNLTVSAEWLEEQPLLRHHLMVVRIISKGTNALVDLTILILVVDRTLFVVKVETTREVEGMMVIATPVTVRAEVGTVIDPPSVGKMIYLLFLVPTFREANHSSEKDLMPLGQNPL